MSASGFIRFVSLPLIPFGVLLPKATGPRNMLRKRTCCFDSLESYLKPLLISIQMPISSGKHTKGCLCQHSPLARHADTDLTLSPTTLAPSECSSQDSWSSMYIYSNSVHIFIFCYHIPVWYNHYAYILHICLFIHIHTVQSTKSWAPCCISKVMLSSSAAERMWQFFASLESLRKAASLQMWSAAMSVDTSTL